MIPTFNQASHAGFLFPVHQMATPGPADHHQADAIMQLCPIVRGRKALQALGFKILFSLFPFSF